MGNPCEKAMVRNKRNFMETISLSEQEFNALPEYSSSNPTGVVIGKKWKRKGLGNIWYLCEYIPCEEEGYADIKIKLISKEGF